MNLLPSSEPDTIVAIATPPGEGAIGIVRLSGPKAIDTVHRIFRPVANRDIRKKGRVFLGLIKEPGSDEPLDEVLVHVMRAPRSYTREDVVEINCHGGAGPVQAILELILSLGVRLAQPGEFTRRAFLNGRIDLVQAEAVIDRIRAQTRAALRAAADASAGVLSRTIHDMRHLLADALARIEAAVDFPEEDLPELVDTALRKQLEDCHDRMEALLATAKTGRLLREGSRVAIIGRPNVGKSSLFNALVRDARAIVTAHPGTTRDLIEEVITLQGIPVRLIDTAGLRHTHDEVEQQGIAVARNAFRSADALLFVVARSEPFTGEDEELAHEILAMDIPAVLVLNKCDKADRPSLPSWTEKFHQAVEVSAHTMAGINRLEEVLGNLLLGDRTRVDGSAILTRAHQKDSLRRAKEAVERLLEHYDESPEFLSIDLREALSALGEITGETTPEDILDRIFSSFCIGK